MVQLPNGTSIISDSLESSLTTENNILDNVYSAKTTDNVLSLTMTLSQPNAVYYLCLLSLIIIVSAILFPYTNGSATAKRGAEPFILSVLIRFILLL